MKKNINSVETLVNKAMIAGGWSLVTLAVAAKVHPNTVAQVRAGIVPGADIRAKIAGTLGKAEAELWPAEGGAK